MAKSIATTHKPKAYARDAVKRLGVLISTIKQDLDEADLAQLRTWYKLAYNHNNNDALYRMVDLLNHKKHQTRSSFQILTTFTREHGQTLEIREDRF